MDIGAILATDESFVFPFHRCDRLITITMSNNVGRPLNTSFAGFSWRQNLSVSIRRSMTVQ